MVLLVSPRTLRCCRARHGRRRRCHRRRRRRCPHHPCARRCAAAACTARTRITAMLARCSAAFCAAVLSVLSAQHLHLAVPLGGAGLLPGSAPNRETPLVSSSQAALELLVQRGNRASGSPGDSRRSSCPPASCAQASLRMSLQSALDQLFSAQPRSSCHFGTNVGSRSYEQNTMRGAGAVAAPLLLGTLALVGGKDRSAGDLVRGSAR